MADRCTSYSLQRCRSRADRPDVGGAPVHVQQHPTSVPHISSGRLRALAVSSSCGSFLLPDLPTISEAGVPGYEAGTWFGLVAPAGTPPDIVARVNGVIVKDLPTRP